MTVALVSLLLAAAAVDYVNAAPALVPRADNQPCWTTYTSLAGDTCDTIAMAFRIPPLDVLNANSFLNCNDIWPNTPICIYGQSQVTVTGIPPAAPTSISGSGTCWTNYRSQPGDTCERIATRFGVTPAAILNANQFLNCNDIWDGTPITICDGARTRTTVVNSTGNQATTTRVSSSGVVIFTSRASSSGVVTFSSSRNPTATATPVSTSVSITTRPGPSSSPISTECWTTYRTLPGETCETIAMAYKIPPIDVSNANPFLNCNSIPVNTNVCIYGQSQVTVTGIIAPAPTTVPGSGTCYTSYRSHPGDSCQTIADRFGMSPSDVWNANKFLDCDNIWDGTPITICDGARTRTTLVNSTTGGYASTVIITATAA